MRTIYTFLFTCFLVGFCHAQIPSGYYNSANGLTGYQLKTALKVIVDDIEDANGLPFHNPQPYSDLDLAYPMPNSGFRDDYTTYDNDGFLDLFLCNKDNSYVIPNQLYHNNGNGTFTNVSAAAGISDVGHLSFCSSFFFCSVT